MNGLSQQEKQDALKAFVDAEQAQLPLVDRSTAENYDCPFKGKAIEEGRAAHIGILAEAGNGVHDAFSAAVLEHIESNGAIGLPDLRNSIEFELRNSRPDVQPEVLRAGRPAIWAWAKFINDIHPENILAFDGGEKIGRSGQFAWDCADLGCRYTLELDFLYAGASPEVLHVVDYKSGWKQWTAAMVQDSFQFQSQAALVLQRYNKCRPGESEPTVKCVSIEVWNTRANKRSYVVEFPRKNLPDYEFRIRRMLDTRRSQWANPECWPWDEKCRVCPAAAICPVAYQPCKTAADKPEEVLKDLIATYGRASALEEILKAQVKVRGHDIQCGKTFYGKDKPKDSRAPKVAMYEIKSKGATDNGDSDTE